MITKVVVFKGLIDRFFPVDLKIPGFKLIDFNDDYKYEADCFLQVNVKKSKTHNLKHYDFIKESGKPYLVLESNPFRKNSFPVSDARCYFRVGWFHFLRQGNFNNKNSPPDRWNKIKTLQNLTVNKWRKQDGNILLCLQKPGDSTLNSLYEKWGNYESWIDYAINTIRNYSDRPIIIRPHIKSPQKVKFGKFISEKNKIILSNNWKNGTIYEGGLGLKHDFDSSYAVIAYNSNVLVESTLEGIPSFPMSDESIVWDISNRIENLETPDLNIDRTSWLYDAGYMIWTAEEINNGIAWNHLKGVFFK